jgi:glycosyltransferase involved in cell wall biosynthesis
VILSVVIITHNEEDNIARTLASVRPLIADGKGEIIVVDSGSTDRTVEIAKSFGAKVFIEEWKGYAAQKNSAIDKAAGEWILTLDADEEVEQPLAMEIAVRFPSTRPNQAELLERVKQSRYLITRKSIREFKKLAKEKGATESGIFAAVTGFWISRKNEFLGRWIKHGGFWPDPKLRLFKRGLARFERRTVHEDAKLIDGISGRLKHSLRHHSYPTLTDYIDHMNRYSSLGAEMAVASGRSGFSLFNIVLRPIATFIYNYFFRLGFLDGREGLLLHLYHAVYVSWKYAKAWELANKKE